MSELQKELKQRIPFQLPEEEAYLNLVRTSYILRLEMESLFKAHGLSGPQYNVLRILRGSMPDGLACSDISERLVFKDSDVTRLLERLEKAGLIEKQQSEIDRRVQVSKITNKGLDVVGILDEPVRETLRSLLAHLGPELLERFNALLVLARSKS
ncbi:MAG: MarR family transcriptional regulator [Pyrinomonadaceae bacterium]